MDSTHLLTSTAGSWEEIDLCGCSLVPQRLATKAEDESVQEHLIPSHGQAEQKHPIWLARGEYHLGT